MSESWPFGMHGSRLGSDGDLGPASRVRKLAFGDKTGIWTSLVSESWPLGMHGSPFRSDGNLGPALRVRKLAFGDTKLAFGRHLGQKVGIW